MTDKNSIDWSAFAEPSLAPTPTASRDEPTTPPDEPKSTPKKKAPAKELPPRLKVNDEKIITDAIVSLYSTIGMGLGVIDMHCGRAIVEASPACAEAWLELAKSNDAIRRALMTLTQTSAWSGVLVAHLPLIMAVGVHHIPAFRGLGTPAEPESDSTGPEQYDINTGAPKW